MSPTFAVVVLGEKTKPFGAASTLRVAAEAAATSARMVIEVYILSGQV